MQKNSSQIGIYGLAVMGANLARNFADKKVQTTVYNRTYKKTKEFIDEHGNEYLQGAKEVKDFINSLEKPRKIILMVKSGSAVDEVIAELTPLLDKKDIIVDMGNSNYMDTEMRQAALGKKSIRFVGCGISGGEEGALNGPSLMPGGAADAWNELKPLLEKIAAKDFGGKPCVTLLGTGGSGQYVKMVHNGIEYAIMQTITEAYGILSTVFDMPAPQVGQIFDNFSRGKLKSFLYELTAVVLQAHDPESNYGYLVDKILDRAEQKGTGMWTVIDAMQRGVPVPTIAEAVMSRIISGDKNKRVTISSLYSKKPITENYNLDECIEKLDDALFTAMICSFAQGIELMQTASKEKQWDLNISEIMRIWQGGCIIRAQLLKSLEECYREKAKRPDTHVFELPQSQANMKGNIKNLREIVGMAVKNGIPAPALASACAYFDGMTQERSAANLIQALRDAFGAHTYSRMDKPGAFQSDWHKLAKK